MGIISLDPIQCRIFRLMSKRKADEGQVFPQGEVASKTPKDGISSKRPSIAPEDPEMGEFEDEWEDEFEEDENVIDRAADELAGEYIITW